MPDRPVHSDNDLIDSMQENAGGATSQLDRSGGNVSRDIGTRAELAEAEGDLAGDKVETATGKDNPGEDSLKGDKTVAELQRQRNES